MALVDVRGFGLNVMPQQGQLAGGLGEIAAFQQLGQQNIQAEKSAQIRQLLGQAGQAAPQTEQQQQLAAQTAGLGGEQALAEQPKGLLSEEELKTQARRIDPVLANQQIKELGLDDPTRRAEASRFAAQLQFVPFDKRADMINARAQSLQSQGRDPKDTLQLLDMTEAEQNEAITGVQLLDLSTKERLGFQAKRAAAKAKAISFEDVKSSKILDDGTTIQVMKSGATRVTSPEGVELEGAERAQAIRDSQEFGVDIQQRRAKGRGLGKGAAKIALDAFDKVSSIRENVVDLKEGIRLVKEEGAETGPIADRFPSFRAGTRKLQNLRRKLGLNVVGAVTFGALSEGELKLAMDVALPDGLSEEEIVDWMEVRIKAQEKLADNMEEAALFLSDPDNSVADFIRLNKSKAAAAKKKAAKKAEQPPPAAPQGGITFLGFE